MTYSESEKSTILILRRENIKWDVISELLGKKTNALKKWFSKNRINLDLPPKPIISKRLTDGRIGLQIKKLVQEKPNLSIRDLERELQKLYPEKTDLPKRTCIHSFCNLNGLIIIKLLKRPLVSDKNRIKRLEFAMKHLEDPEDLIDRTLWSDETSVRKAPNGKNVYYRVHNSVKKEDLPFNCQIQGGGFSVMFWGVFSIWGFGPLVALEGTQNQHTYVELLKEYLVPEINFARDKLKIELQFMQDNAPCHKTKKVDNFFSTHSIEVLDWPAQSPDLNPIENIWNIIKFRRKKKFGFPRTKEELIDQIFEIWNSLEEDLCHSCIGSMENRLNEVLRLQGRSIGY